MSASTSQVADKTSESTVASSEATSGTNTSSETATNFDVSALTRAAVNTSLVNRLQLQQATSQAKELMSTRNVQRLRINLRFLPRLNFM